MRRLTTSSQRLHVCAYRLLELLSFSPRTKYCLLLLLARGLVRRYETGDNVRYDGVRPSTHAECRSPSTRDFVDTSVQVADTYREIVACISKAVSALLLEKAGTMRQKVSRHLRGVHVHSDLGMLIKLPSKIDEEKGERSRPKITQPVMKSGRCFCFCVSVAYRHLQSDHSSRDRVVTRVQPECYHRRGVEREVSLLDGERRGGIQ